MLLSLSEAYIVELDAGSKKYKADALTYLNQQLLSPADGLDFNIIKVAVSEFVDFIGSLYADWRW